MIPLLHPMCICRFRSKWSKFASTPQGAFTEVRSTARACCCLDRLYAYGGTDQNQRVHSSLEAYNPEVCPLKRLGMGHLLWRCVWNIMEYLENLSENYSVIRDLPFSTMSSALISFARQALGFSASPCKCQGCGITECACCCHLQRVQSENCITCGKVHLSMHFMPIHFCLQIHHVLHTAYCSILHRQASMCYVCHCQNWGKWPILRLLRDSHQSIKRVLNLYIHHIDII